LVLMLIITTMLIPLIPIVNADGVPTIFFITIAPNLIGIGQTATVSTWLSVVRARIDWDYAASSDNATFIVQEGFCLGI